MAEHATANDIQSSASRPPAGAAVACAMCGTPAPGGEQPLTWTRSVEGTGRAAVVQVFCDRCSREHVRAIESKLDAAWW